MLPKGIRSAPLGPPGEIHSNFGIGGYKTQSFSNNSFDDNPIGARPADFENDYDDEYHRLAEQVVEGGMDDDMQSCPSGVITTIFSTVDTSYFVSLTFNGEGIRIPLEPTKGEVTKTYFISDKVNHFPSRRFFDVSISMIIPFDLEGSPLEGKKFNVRAEFIEETEESSIPAKRRTYFLGSLDAGCKPIPAFVAKVLFRPTKVVFRITDDNAPVLNPHTERLTTSVLDLLDLECVTGYEKLLNYVLKYSDVVVVATHFFLLNKKKNKKTQFWSSEGNTTPFRY